MNQAASSAASRRLRIVPMGLTLSLFVAITYTLCVAFGLIVPGYGLHEPWLQFFPGFKWLTWRGYLIGLGESIGYGWYAALVFVPLYNFFHRTRG